MRIASRFAIMMLAWGMLASASSCAPAEQRREGFVPLAEIRISPASTDGAAVVATIREFAKQEHLRAETGELGRRGRGVNQIRVWISKVSFFYGDDFVDEESFLLRAYSHEDETTWRPAWTRLREHLKRSFAVSDAK